MAKEKIVNNSKIGTVEGSNTGETGKTTIQFPSINYQIYMMPLGTDFLEILVQGAPTCVATSLKTGQTQTVTANGNYNFTISGLDWYVTPQAFYLK